MTIDKDQLRATAEQLGLTPEELDAYAKEIRALTTAFTLCATGAVIYPQETEDQIRALGHEQATNLALGGVMAYIELFADFVKVQTRVKELEDQLVRLN